MIEAIVSAKPHEVMIVTKSTMTRRQTFCPRLKTALPDADIPVKPAFIQVGVRKHDVALAVGHVALPILQAHGAK
jgi:hypothetical protein